MTSPALRTLLSGLIDYAGLFPPAGLGMAEAVRNYDTYVRGEHAWMLGRFIVPAARLAEYEDTVRNSGLDANAWSLSVLATASDADIISRFNIGGDESGASGLGSIDTLEIKLGVRARFRLRRRHLAATTGSTARRRRKSGTRYSRRLQWPGQEQRSGPAANRKAQFPRSRGCSNFCALRASGGWPSRRQQVFTIRCARCSVLLTVLTARRQ